MDNLDLSNVLEGISNGDLSWVLRGEYPTPGTPPPNNSPSGASPSPLEDSASPSASPPPPQKANATGMPLENSEKPSGASTAVSAFPQPALTTAAVSTAAATTVPAPSRSRSASESSTSKRKSGFFGKLTRKLKGESEGASSPPHSKDTPTVVPVPRVSPTSPTLSQTPLHRTQTVQIPSSSMTKLSRVNSAPMPPTSKSPGALGDYLEYYRSLKSDTSAGAVSKATSSPHQPSASTQPLPPAIKATSYPIRVNLKEIGNAEKGKVVEYGYTAYGGNTLSAANSNAAAIAFREHCASQSECEPSGGLFGRRSSVSEGWKGLLNSRRSSVADVSAAPTPKTATKPLPSPEPVPSPSPEVPVLKHVSFTSSTFSIDPPQQIPSRNPRRGNVEVIRTDSPLNPNQIIVHPLTAEDKQSIQHKTGRGIVVGGRMFLKGEEAETLALAEAKAEAEALGRPVGGEAAESKSAGDAALVAQASIELDHAHAPSAAPIASIAVDTPMVRHPPKAPQVHFMALDLMYTRCCHLREILPIPGTLKQIPKGTMDPLPVISLSNTKPSLVEVLSFADFVRIAPVIHVSLDGCNLSVDMFRILLSAMVFKNNLQKLSLRNTPIDTDGWSLLCLFLSRSRVPKLDITQVPMVSKNPVKKETSGTIKRMESSAVGRSERNWSEFVAALIVRGGIEELILSGCQLPELVFEQLMKQAIPLKTVRLGLAHNRLTIVQLEHLCQWLTKPENLKVIRGLDLGYNDLSHSVPLFTAVAKAHVSQPADVSSLSLISFNSTNLPNTTEVAELIAAMSQLPGLKYVDLSGNKKLFPGFIEQLALRLPLFPQLSRLNLDYNGLDTDSIVRLAEVLPLCFSLNYVSLIGNPLSNQSVVALAAALRASSSIITLDIDYDSVSAQLKEKIGLLTMKNAAKLVQRRAAMPSTFNPHADSVTDEIIRLFREINSGGDAPSSIEIESFVEKCSVIRKHLHDSMTDLFKLQLRDSLTTEGKETLIRLCFFDSSMEKALGLLKHKLHGGATLIDDAATKLDLSVAGRSHVKYIAESRAEDEDRLDPTSESDEPAQEIPRTSSQPKVSSTTNEGEGRALVMSKLIPSCSTSKFSNLTGDEIRMQLENSESSEVIEYLKGLRTSGISLESLFEKVSGQGMTIESLKNAIEGTGREESPSNTKAPVPEAAETTFNGEKSGEEGEKEGEVHSEESDEVLNEAYDELLNGLVRVKTQT